MRSHMVYFWKILISNRWPAKYSTRLQSLQKGRVSFVCLFAVSTVVSYSNSWHIMDNIV